MSQCYGFQFGMRAAYEKYFDSKAAAIAYAQFNRHYHDKMVYIRLPDGTDLQSSVIIFGLSGFFEWTEWE